MDERKQNDMLPDGFCKLIGAQIDIMASIRYLRPLMNTYHIQTDSAVWASVLALKSFSRARKVTLYSPPTPCGSLSSPRSADPLRCASKHTPLSYFYPEPGRKCYNPRTRASNLFAPNAGIWIGSPNSMGLIVPGKQPATPCSDPAAVGEVSTPRRRPRIPQAHTPRTAPDGAPRARRIPMWGLTSCSPR